MISGKAHTLTDPDRRFPETRFGVAHLHPVIRNRFDSDAHAPVRLHNPFELPQTTGSSWT